MALRVPNQIRKKQPININMTSMVDIVFLLIIFFMLVSSFISAENVRLELPQPEKSMAKVLDIPQRLVLNCRYVDSAPDTAQYHLGPVRLTGVEELQKRLEAAHAKDPDVEVIIRADKRIRYRRIRDAMKCVAAAGIKNMNVAAEIQD